MSVQDKASGISAICMADVVLKVVEWLWYPFIALGKVVLLTGNEGVGKSFLTCAIAAAVSRGLFIPYIGKFLLGNVLMFTTEDGLADTVLPRLKNCGADLSHIFAYDKPFTLSRAGLLMLKQLIAKHRVKLVIIDPFYGYVGANANINQDNVLRSFMALLVRHFNKAKGFGDARSAGLGGIGLRASARIELFAGQNPDDENDRALIVDKSNLAGRGAAVGYTIQDGKFYWKPETKLTVQHILASVVDEDQRSERTEAVATLRELLTGVAVHSDEVLSEMKTLGFSEYATRKAQRALHIKPKRAGGKFGGKGGKWWWELPQQESEKDKQDIESIKSQHLVVNNNNKDIYNNGLAQDVETSKIQHLVESETLSCDESLGLTDQVKGITKAEEALPYPSEDDEVLKLWE
ncbi:MAG: AAA family ATPase [Acidobacteriota bacterium]|nr:AAA family ATPase [Acidobacteriota bacterium]